MREYKFRGKRLDNGEWVEGFGVEVYETMGNETKACLYTNQDEYMVVNNYFVDPATVGQYTGLKDKHGKEIYEGDIVKGFKESHWHGGTDKVKGHVFFNDESLNMLVSGSGKLANVEDIEVIGNIHDNQELLEG